MPLDSHEERNEYRSTIEALLPAALWGLGDGGPGQPLAVHGLTLEGSHTLDLRVELADPETVVRVDALEAPGLLLAGHELLDGRGGDGRRWLTLEFVLLQRPMQCIGLHQARID